MSNLEQVLQHPHCHKSPRLMNNLSTCGQVYMIFMKENAHTQLGNVNVVPLLYVSVL